MRLPAVAVPLLALAVGLAAAACGGDDRSVETWATTVCAEVNEWADDVDVAIETFADQGLAVDQDDVRRAASSVADATESLEADLNELGPPETEAGRRAREELESLSEALRGRLDEIEGAIDSDAQPLEVVAMIAAALASAANEVQETMDALEGIDPGGELAAAFRESDQCDTLRRRIGGGDS